MLLGSVASGCLKGLLLIDAVDYDVYVGQEVIIPDASTIPTTGTIQISYHTSRPDQSIDVYIKKNNIVLDKPQHIRLFINPLLDRKQDKQELRVTSHIDMFGRLSFVVENIQPGLKINYSWDQIRTRLMGSV